MVFPDGRVVHIKFNLPEAYYDDLFPPSLFTEPATQPPDVASEDIPHAAKMEERANVVDDAFEDVEEVNPFVGKTQVCYF